MDVRDSDNQVATRDDNAPDTEFRRDRSDSGERIVGNPNTVAHACPRKVLYRGWYTSCTYDAQRYPVVMCASAVFHGAHDLHA